MANLVIHTVHFKIIIPEIPIWIINKKIFNADGLWNLSGLTTRMRRTILPKLMALLIGILAKRARVV